MIKVLTWILFSCIVLSMSIVFIVAILHMLDIMCGCISFGLF